MSPVYQCEYRQNSERTNESSRLHIQQIRFHSQTQLLRDTSLGPLADQTRIETGRTLCLKKYLNRDTNSYITFNTTSNRSSSVPRWIRGYQPHIDR